MSEKEQSIDSNQNIEKIKIYDNDDAYLFGDASINESNEEEEYKEKIEYENENNIISPNQLSNKLIQEGKFGQETLKNNSEKINIIKKNNNEEDYKYNSFETNSKEDQILNNEKYIINDITTDMENEQENESNSIYNNKTNNINYNKEIKNNDNQITNENENESNESEIPLITLNFLSICQCCRNKFNSTNNIPYLFKCGHFFCKECIEEKFIDEEGIKCPNDGLIGKYISELKILNNFINDKPIKHQIKSKKKYCEYHKGQNLTHYVEDTKELICVYCAFERFKTNPNSEIKDINEKYKSMENKIDNIIDDNQQNVEIIQNYLRDIKKNKENEEKKLNDVFNRLLEIIKIKKEEIISHIEKIFSDNAKKLSNQLELFSSRLEKSQRIKNQIFSFKNNLEEISFSQLIEIYESFIKEINNINKITLQKYNFTYDDEYKLRDIINKFGELKLSEKSCNFILDNSKISIKEDLINNNNAYNNQSFIKVNKENKVINNSDSYKIDNFYHFINNKEKTNINEVSNLSKKDSKNINNQKTNSINDKNINKNIRTNINNKSSGNLKRNNNYNNIKRKNNKNKVSNIKKYINNKKGLLLDMTSSTYGNSLSKIENHTIGGIRVNTPKTYIKNYKYNLSLGQNYSFNNIQYLNSLNNNHKINNSIKTNDIKNKNSKSKNNKSITTPNRINLKKDNHCKNK